MKILLAQPRGFCAGVDRAIAIVERALAVHGAPIYVRHEIVHNKHVVNSLREKGSIFVNEIDEVPDGSVLVFSAHGVPKAVEEKARARDLTIYDATCPLVTKVHMEVIKMHKQGDRIIMIGHAGHPEVEGRSDKLIPKSMSLKNLLRSGIWRSRTRKKLPMSVRQRFPTMTPKG